MAKKKAAPQRVEPEDESQEPPEQQELEATPPETPARASKPTQPVASKAEAVRQALAAGKDSPDEGTKFIKSRYGIDMTNQMFSSYKAQQKARDSKASGGAKPGRKPRTASQAVEGYLAPPPRPKAASGAADLIESLETLKPLIAQYGADKVKRLVDLLG